MAINAIPITGDTLTDLQADKPMLVGRNAMQYADFQGGRVCTSAVVTVVAWNNGNGDTLTVTIDDVANVLTEGVDFNAATNNDTTAGNIATAIDALDGVSASAAAAVVTITTGTASDIGLSTGDVTAWTVEDANDSDDLVSAIWTQTGNSYDDDESATDYEGLYAHDGHHYKGSKPDAVQNTWYLSFSRRSQSSVSISPGINFDVALIVVDADSIEDDTTIDLQVDTEGSFTSPLTLTTGLTGADLTGNRLFLVTLDHVATTAKYYSGVQYWRLKFDKGTGAAIQPIVYELWLGSRFQLAHHFLRPYDPEPYDVMVDAFESRNGVQTEIEHYTGRRLLQGMVPIFETAQINAAESFLRYTRYGARKFLWIPEPYSNPNECLIMNFVTRGRMMKYKGPFEREFRLRAVENAPFFENERGF